MFRWLAGVKSSILPTSETTMLRKSHSLQLLRVQFKAIRRQREAYIYIGTIKYYLGIHLINIFLCILKTHKTISVVQVTFLNFNYWKNPKFLHVPPANRPPATSGTRTTV
jgi:hypothetical protein